MKCWVLCASPLHLDMSWPSARYFLVYHVLTCWWSITFSSQHLPRHDRIYLQGQLCVSLDHVEASSHLAVAQLRWQSSWPPSSVLLHWPAQVPSHANVTWMLPSQFGAWHRKSWIFWVCQDAIRLLSDFIQKGWRVMTQKQCSPRRAPW